jgi:hypothetical protein
MAEDWSTELAYYWEDAATHPDNMAQLPYEIGVARIERVVMAKASLVALKAAIGQ